jgi:hypothetical protein
MQWFTQPCGGGKGAQCCLRCVVEPYIGLGDAACLQQLVKVARQLPRREAKRRCAVIAQLLLQLRLQMRLQLHLHLHPQWL